MAAMLLEHCQIYPSSEPHEEFSLPLTHFDIPFLKSAPIQRLLFIDFPCSKSHFLERILPHLKESLSSTISHFLPLAGNIIISSSNSEKPRIRYVSGDSVSLRIAQCEKDLNYLTENHQRDADEFYPCVPELPNVTRSFDSVMIPVTALQITLFLEQGICIGLTNSHVMSDESSIVHFLKSWAFFNKFKSGLLEENSLPFYERTNVQDPDGLDSIAWNMVKKSRPFPVEKNFQIIPPGNKVRSTFIITKNNIEKLRKYALDKLPGNNISSFTAICAFIWSCSERAVAETCENVSDHEMIRFPFAAECRTRLKPVPLPSNYFGNCVVFVTAYSEHGRIKGDEGFLVAAEAIGKAIREIVNHEDGILAGADWPKEFGVSKARKVSVAGSPRFDVYGIDFGWGKMKKYEFVHLDYETSMSLCKSREYEGGFEIGLSRTKMEMDAFEVAFNQGLERIEKDLA